MRDILSFSTFCRHFIVLSFDSDSFFKVKQFIFCNGDAEIDLNLEQIMKKIATTKYSEMQKLI